jgi:hypothetical protein
VSRVAGHICAYRLGNAQPAMRGLAASS